jgi:hypothetical protein
MTSGGPSAVPGTPWRWDAAARRWLARLAVVGARPVDAELPRIGYPPSGRTNLGMALPMFGSTHIPAYTQPRSTRQKRPSDIVPIGDYHLGLLSALMMVFAGLSKMPKPSRGTAQPSRTATKPRARTRRKADRTAAVPDDERSRYPAPAQHAVSSYVGKFSRIAVS